MLFFDLDETLYPRASGVVPRIDLRINRYLEEKLRIHADEVDRVRRGWWAEFGTTLAGLQAHHSIDPDDYLRFIHDIELDDVLARDEALLSLLTELPSRKAVFTNASRWHAARVLERLGVATAFEAVVALEDLGYVPKPAAGAFARVLERTAAQAAESTLIDDNRANLLAAKALGMRTIWVGEGAVPDGADAVVTTIHDLMTTASWIGRDRRRRGPLAMPNQ